MKKRVVAGIIAGTMAMAMTVQASAAPKAKQYPGLLRVTEVQGDEVTGVDANGFIWSFEAEGNDYEEDDLCAVIYDDMGSEIIFDDEIVAHRYVGTTKMYGGSK